MARRQYSIQEKADCLAILKQNGGALHQTAREMGIPYATVSLWAAQQAATPKPSPPRAPVRPLDPDEQQAVAGAETDLAAQWRKLRELAMNGITPQQLALATARERVSIAKIASEMERAVTAGAAEAAEVRVERTNEERVARIQQLLRLGGATPEIAPVAPPLAIPETKTDGG